MVRVGCPCGLSECRECHPHGCSEQLHCECCGHVIDEDNSFVCEYCGEHTCESCKSDQLEKHCHVCEEELQEAAINE